MGQLAGTGPWAGTAATDGPAVAIAVPARPAVTGTLPAPGRRPARAEPHRTVPPGAGSGPRRAAQAPQASAAELRELAEIGDLLSELAALVQDLGSLVVGLMTAAAGCGDRQVRTFAVPAELTELATAYQQLRAEQHALSARFAANAAAPERAALRVSLAALTEQATRAIIAVAAVSFPAPRPPGPANVQPPVNPPTILETPADTKTPADTETPRSPGEPGHRDAGRHRGAR